MIVLISYHKVHVEEGSDDDGSSNIRAKLGYLDGIIEEILDDMLNHTGHISDMGYVVLHH